MADRRKLQGEIDRCLKKVTEGVEVFDDLWQKVQGATNCNTKEKHEADLKKEIKKLQRLRDGIKTWLAASEIKDKKPLLDSKKLIEVQMERFKVVERETKTKAYSKEGLGAATKVDPKEKEKEDIITWLSHSIDDLNVQIDQFESEIESVQARKKKLDRDKQDQVEVFRSYLEKHRFHIDKLETIMRLVDNDALQLSQITTIKEDVEHYIKSCRDPDFEENEFIYEDLKLEEACAALGSKLAAMSVHDNDDHGSNVSDLSLQNSSSPSPSPSIAAHSKDMLDEDSRTRLKSQSEDVNHSSRSSSSSLQKQNSLVNANSLNAGSSSVGGGGGSGGGSSAKASQSPSVWQAATSFSSGLSPEGAVSTTAATQLFVQNYAQAASANHTGGSNSTQEKASSRSSGDHVRSQPTTPVASSHVASSGNSAPNLAAKPMPAGGLCGASTSLKLSTSATSTVTSSLSPQPSSAPASASETNLLADLTSPSVPIHLSPQLPQSASLSGNLQLLFSNQQQLSSTTSTEVKASVNGPTSCNVGLPLLQITTGSEILLGTSKPGSQPATPNDISSSLALSSQAPLLVNVNLSRGTSFSSMSSPRVLQQMTGSLPGSFPLPVSRSHTPATSTIRLNPILGVAPLGPQPLDHEHALQQRMLDAASYHLPLPMDSQRVRLYLPSSPYPMPPYYTQLHPSVADSPEFFQRLHPETLFFIFYYMEGTKAQNMAARALKQLSWRFHTKFLMWFQRHEEPKVITEDFEQGTYIYFDYEKWAQRKKEGFVFEYKFLEDLN